MIIAMPNDLDFRNGGEKCDMLAGPCSCGATHSLEDLAYRIFTQLRARPTTNKQREALEYIAENIANTPWGHVAAQALKEDGE